VAAPARIGLTGGIGTGKSFVLRYLARCGVPTLDTDTVAREVTRRGQPACALVVRRFGPGVVGPDGELDRAELARIVFADVTARRDLEGILHPAIWASVDAWLAGVTQPGVVAVPLLFETGAEGRFDRTLVTDCPEAVQITRVVARDGATEDAVRARVAAQMPAAERRRRADAVLDTGGSPDQTIAQLGAVWRKWELPPLVPREA